MSKSSIIFSYRLIHFYFFITHFITHLILFSQKSLLQNSRDDSSANVCIFLAFQPSRLMHICQAVLALEHTAEREGAQALSFPEKFEKFCTCTWQNLLYLWVVLAATLAMINTQVATVRKYLVFQHEIQYLNNQNQIVNSFSSPLQAELHV